jgi:sugar-specific transcriptional regulator TrmB
MQIEVILKNFGLSEKEIGVYLALIELGPAPVREIALKSKVNRGTTYDILKSLMEIGVVSYYNKESKQYFMAEPPEKLLAAVDAKKDQLEEIKTHLRDNLPLLKTLFEKQGGKPAVKLYEGIKGIRHILEDVLESMENCRDKTYYVYSSTSVRKNVYLAMKEFSDQRIKKKIQVKTIALGEGGQLVGLDERKWMKLPQGGLKATYEIIYCGKVAHISLDDAENPVGVVIQNEPIYQTQKMIFEHNWDKL